MKKVTIPFADLMAVIHMINEDGITPEVVMAFKEWQTQARDFPDEELTASQRDLLMRIYAPVTGSGFLSYESVDLRHPDVRTLRRLGLIETGEKQEVCHFNGTPDGIKKITTGFVARLTERGYAEVEKHRIINNEPQRFVKLTKEEAEARYMVLSPEETKRLLDK